MQGFSAPLTSKKQLEKFGFTHNGDFYLLCINEEDYTCDITIEEDTRLFYLDTHIKWGEEFNIYNDLLYELIKNDMVEKVENE